MSPSPRRLRWDRRAATQTTPQIGSLVNVRRAGEKSVWQGRLGCSLSGQSFDGQTVSIEVGAPGRRGEVVHVAPHEILGPHLPTKIKTPDGDFAKDAARRRGESGAALDAAQSRAAWGRSQSALGWIDTLKPLRREAQLEAEKQWFNDNWGELKRMARAGAARLGIRDSGFGIRMPSPICCKVAL